jgi:hypothetical protein
MHILFVSYHNGRFLSMSNSARKVDWTGEFVDINIIRKPTSYINNQIIDTIDVVYTWVDSSDPNWQKIRKKYISDSHAKLESAGNEERFLDRDELKYSLRSLWMYAPFVRNIYIITAEHVPTWLNLNSNQIRIVSHKEIFPDEKMLPTFNSHAIEACLHRIEGLSDYFIYFNDDVFLGNEVMEEDFFTKSGLLKIRFSMPQFIIEGRPHINDIPTHWAAYNAVGLIKKDFGISFNRKLKHVPFPLKKSILYEIEARYPQEVLKTRNSKFRSSSDLAIPSMFSAFYCIATKQGVEWPDNPGEYVYADTGKYDFYQKLSIITDKTPKFFCLNSTKYRDISLYQQAEIMQGFLEYLYPIPSPFEKVNNK